MATDNNYWKEKKTSELLASDLKSKLDACGQRPVTPASGITNWISSAFQRIWTKTDPNRDDNQTGEASQRKEELCSLLERRDEILRQIDAIESKKIVSDQKMASIRETSLAPTQVHSRPKRKPEDLRPKSQLPKRIRQDQLSTNNLVHQPVKNFTLKDLLRKGEESRRKTQLMQQKKYVIEVPALQESPKSIPPRQRDDTHQYILSSQTDGPSEKWEPTFFGALQQPTQTIHESQISRIGELGEKVYDAETVAAFDDENNIAQWRKKKQFGNN